MGTTRKKDRIVKRFSSDDVFLLGGVLYRFCILFWTVFDFHRSWTPVKDLDLFGRATKIHAAQKLLFGVPETRNGTDGSDVGRIYEVQLENQAHRIQWDVAGIWKPTWMATICGKCRKKRYQSHGSYWRPGLLLSISLLPDLHNWLRSPVWISMDFVGILVPWWLCGSIDTHPSHGRGSE